MPFVDPTAASLLEDLMEENGLSPESLAEAITSMARQKFGGSKGAIDAYTIRRALGRGGRPPLKPGHSRTRFLIAHYFGKRPDEIWRDSQQFWITSEQAKQKRVRVMA